MLWLPTTELSSCDVFACVGWCCHVLPWLVVCRLACLSRCLPVHGTGLCRQPYNARTLQCPLQVFARSEEVGLWLLIDDASVQLVGRWGDVLRTMCAKRLQPSLLFYEAERKAPMA